MEDKRFAVLIDSDNISAKYVAGILAEMTKYGIITYKRIYGDWTSSHTTKWKKELLENSITPIQQFSNTTGKNATDSALIIDAMDILYTGSVDGFCIVSSDSDFTRLASRLRESGMDVIGMGEEKTPRSFRAACSVFTSLEILMDNDEESDTTTRDKEGGVVPSRNENAISKATIEKDIIDIIIESENKGAAAGLADIGNRLIKKYPDFDVRNYGYSRLSKFMEEMPELEVHKENNVYTVKLKDNEQASEEIVNYIKKLVKDSKGRGIYLSELGNLLNSRYKTFNVKDYGYSKFSKFVQSFWELEIREDAAKRNVVYYK
jgi:Uncharacterized conserved protein